MARVVALIPDLLFASRVQGMLAAAGHDVTLTATLGDVEGVDVVVVDLTTGTIDPEALDTGSARTLGVFAHVEPEVRERALAAGFDQVVPRSRMAREGADLVGRLAHA